jgi:hypothetical protein
VEIKMKLMKKDKNPYITGILLDAFFLGHFARI